MRSIRSTSLFLVFSSCLALYAKIGSTDELAAGKTAFAGEYAATVDVVEDFGAIGDGVTDDTEAIQNAVNAVYDAGGGLILFPAGTYIVTSVDIRENITYEGYEATIKRPSLQPAGTRTFTTQNFPYQGETNSDSLVIRGLTFDGNSSEQGAYQNNELINSDLIFLTGNSGFPGRLQVLIEDCTFKNGVSGGISIYVNTDVTVKNCEAIDVFRGGFFLNGGYSSLEVYDFTTSGDIDPTGIDIEVNGAGYGDSKKVDVKLERLNLINGDFDISVSDSSSVTGDNIISDDGPFYIWGQDSFINFTNSSFKVGLSGEMNFIKVPYDVTFDNCDFIVTRQGEGEGNYGIHVLWGYSWLPPENYSLVFNDCRFSVDETILEEDYTYAVNSYADTKQSNNVLTITGGSISGDFDTGLHMQQGGKWIVKNVNIKAALPIFVNGVGTAWGDYHHDVLIDSVTIESERYIHINAINENNILTHGNVIVDETANYITTSYGLEGNQYIGHRVIMGTEQPTSLTHGLINDIYTLKDPVPGETFEWKCINPGYFNIRSQSTTYSVWEPLGDFPVKRVVDIVEDFGAAGDGITDDTNAIQDAVNTLYGSGGGVILFPAGTYIVTSVDIREKITYEGYEAVIKRPPMQPKWTRTFTTENVPYQGESDSDSLIIRGLTFDGNSSEQGPYQNYELEHSDLLFLSGNNNYPGKLRVFIEDCIIKNGVSDGISVYANTDVKITNSSAIDCFRGGFVLTGGYSSVELYNFTTSGDIDPTGIDIEVDGAGYDGSEKVDVKLEKLNLIEGDFDIAVSDGSTIYGNEIITGKGPFNIYGIDSVMHFTNSTFHFGLMDSYSNRILFPHDITFENCDFIITREDETSGGIYGVQVWFNIGWAETQQNESLAFNNCRFSVNKDTILDEDDVYAIYMLHDSKDNNNVLTVNGGHISSDFDTGLYMFEGGKWVIKNVTIEAPIPLSINGALKEWGENTFDVLIDGVNVLSDTCMYLQSYSTQSMLSHENMVIDETANHIISKYDPDINQIAGHRLIMGTLPPDSTTHAFINDIYRLKNPVSGETFEWKCTKSGYYYALREYTVASAWEPLETSGTADVPNKSFRVFPPAPNPFNPSTTITYQFPDQCRVKVVVYDVLGRKVAVLEDSLKPAGLHYTLWNGKNDSGEPVGSGVYLFSVIAGKYSGFEKVLLVR